MVLDYLLLQIFNLFYSLNSFFLNGYWYMMLMMLLCTAINWLSNSISRVTIDCIRELVSQCDVTYDLFPVPTK